MRYTNTRLLLLLLASTVKLNPPPNGSFMRWHLRSVRLSVVCLSPARLMLPLQAAVSVFDIGFQNI